MYEWEVQAMKSLHLTVLMAGLLAAWGTSPPVVQAQGVHSAAAPMQVWNRTSEGMSSNAALAFYRVQNVGRPTMQASAWPQYSRSPAVVNYPVVVNYPASPYAENSYYPAAGSSSTQLQKPFAYVRPAPTAFDRYWPYLLEGYEDPETGFIIWTMP